MKRWMPMAIVAGTLFVVNVAGRVGAEVIVGSKDQSVQNLIGVAGLAAMGIVGIVAGVWWSMRKPMQRIVAELGPALLIGTALSVLVGPLPVGGNPFAGGVGLVLAELLMFFAVSVVAVFLGFLAVTVLGMDYRSRHLKRVEHHYGRGRR